MTCIQKFNKYSSFVLKCWRSIKNSQAREICPDLLPFVLLCFTYELKAVDTWRGLGFDTFLVEETKYITVLWRRHERSKCQVKIYLTCSSLTTFLTAEDCSSACAVSYSCMQTLCFQGSHSAPKKHRGSCNSSFYSIFHWAIDLLHRELLKFIFSFHV